MLADNVQWSEEQIDVAIKQARALQICHVAQRACCVYRIPMMHAVNPACLAEHGPLCRGT